MELTDIAPLDVWARLEQDAYEKFNLQGSVFNAAGMRITGTKNWANPLCPKIKSTDKGQTFICATAHMNMANEARLTGEPVIEECDAGLVRIIVPIMVNDEFLGAAGGCGLLLNDGEVDVFAVNKMTDIDEDTIQTLSENIPGITSQKAQAASEFFNERIHAIIAQK